MLNEELGLKEGRKSRGDGREVLMDGGMDLH